MENKTDVDAAPVDAVVMPDIPAGVSYRPDVDNFYLDGTHAGMGLKFYVKWHDRRNEFPQLEPTW